MRSALEVVVRKDRAAHDGKVGVGTDEVMRNGVHEVEETRERLAVDVHGTMMRAHGDTVLVEVGVGGVLQAPALAIEFDRHDTQILARRMGTAHGRGAASGVALVLDAELAGGILLAGVLGGTSGGDIAWVLLGLGEVDGDLQLAPTCGRGPLDVAGDGGAAYVATVAAELVEPVGRGFGFMHANTAVPFLYDP